MNLRHIVRPANRTDFVEKRTFKQLKTSVFIHLKRNRTLYRNLIEIEVISVRNLLDQDIREVDLKAFSHKVETCINRLNEFTE